MPDKEPQRPSGRGEGGQGAREGLGGRKVSAPSSSSSPEAGEATGTRGQAAWKVCDGKGSFGPNSRGFGIPGRCR